VKNLAGDPGFQKSSRSLEHFLLPKNQRFKAATLRASRYSRLSENYQSITFKKNPSEGLQWSHDIYRQVAEQPLM
jgi:hypothetical protein